MKTPSAIAAVVLLVPSVVRADDAADLKKMQGTWKILVMQRGGKDAPPAILKGKMAVEKNTFTLVVTKDGKEQRAPIQVKLDSSKLPRQMDFTGKDGKLKHHGIYEFDGKKLKICFDLIANERPRTFESKSGTSVRLMVLEPKK